MDSNSQGMVGTSHSDATQLWGDELKIVRQLSAAISRKVMHTCTATVLVQKDAPPDLLLQIDVHTQLGFLLEEPVSSVVQLIQAAVQTAIQTCEVCTGQWPIV